MEAAENQWDKILASVTARQASLPKSPEKRPKLAMDMQSTPRHWPAVKRSLDRIPATLRQVLRSLVSGESPWPAFIHGPPGTGKTCAGLCLADHTPGAEWWTVSEFHEVVCAVRMGTHTFSTEGGGGTFNTGSWWRFIESRPLVVLDEIGLRDRVSEPMYESVKMLLDKRQGKPLLVTSNLPIERIAAIFDDRILDRLICGTVFKIDGESMRHEP